jgi:predicted GNAT family N-acyltransferase
VTLFKPISTPPTPGRRLRTAVVPWTEAKPDVYLVRQEVFVEEQRLAHSVVDDPDDQLSVHVIASIDGEVAGVGRVTFLADDGQIAWVAVRRPLRRHGVGLAIMRQLIGVCIDEGCRTISLNAQTHALSFYERLGFRALGRRFRMSGIEHQHMMMDVDSPEPRHRESRYR